MIAVWIGVALFAVSWLSGLGYYHGAEGLPWTLLTLLGTAGFFGLPLPRTPGEVGRGLPPGRLYRRTALLAAAVSLPALFVAPVPYKAACLLLTIGLAAYAALPASRPVRRAATAAVVAGVVLLAQGLAISLYAAATARAHDLPAPLPWLLGAVARLLGIDAAVHGSTIALHSMREVHLLGANWELWLDPPTCCFLAGAAALLVWQAGTYVRPEQRRPWLIRSLITLAAATALWLPLRSGLFMAWYLHDVLRTEYEANLTAMRLAWSTWVHLALLAGPVVVCWRFLPRLPDVESADDLPKATDRTRAAWRGVVPLSLLTARTVGWVSDPTRAWRNLIPLSLLAVGIGVITVGVYWDPVGTRQAGRVLVEEYHPQPEKIWEPTDKPFDTAWYGHLAGYNYSCIYDYCSRYYTMSRSTQPLDDDALEAVDVLVVKIPTRPFSPPEVRSVRRFVERGGGLLLIGEHTNVFHSSEYLNPLARLFGFEFRADCLFGVDTVFDQRYELPLVPHPIVQALPPLDFATSCSIAPGASSGRTVICGTGLKNLTADYHADNFYPQPEDRAEMRSGAFVQLWATRYGRGRVVGFTDSTIFSNFCTFEPGKAELMLGMIEWLNHRSWLRNPRPWLVGGGLVLLLCGVGWAGTRRSPGGWLMLLAAGLLGWSAAVVGVRTANQRAMPLPSPERPLVRVVVDRTLSDVPLSKSGFIGGSEDGFGIFERWILRLGYFTARREGPAACDGDLLIFFYPQLTVGPQFRQSLVDYVSAGGKVLVIDSAANRDSTSNQLLEPFGLVVERTPVAGDLQAATWPRVPCEQAVVVSGGDPFVRIAGQVVGASRRHGAGLVAVVGFGARFTDAQMGVSGDVIPDEPLQRVFDLQFALLRALVEGGLPAEE